MSALVGYALGLLSACALLHLLRPMALRLELVDRPNPRKSHNGRVPLVGGVAMFCGFALAALTLPIGLTDYRSFFAAAAILVMVGVFDDLHELSSRSRFGAQIIAAALMAYWGGIVLRDLGALRLDGSLFLLSGWEIAFTVFATVGVINALNMSDGIDGLAGGLGLIALLGLAYVAHGAGRVEEGTLLVLLAVVVVAFLAFNLRFPGRSQALVFMGDAGSMFLGFAITWFFIGMSQGEERAMAPVLALWLLAIPLFDTVWLILRRFSQGRSPTTADIEHLHHVIQMTGVSAEKTVWLMLAGAASLAIFAIVALERGVAESTMFFVFLALFALYCVIMAVGWHTRRLLWWPIDRRVGELERRESTDRREVNRRGVGDRRSGGDIPQ
jgi:UDP-GlcNAc:undecaprenyl-phosphate GlcNAc-1-phosphate transferase